MKYSEKVLTHLNVGGKNYYYYRINDLPGVSSLPYALKILLENLLRHQDEKTVTASDIKALLSRTPGNIENREISFRPARVLMQDFTGVPAVVDLAAMRDAMVELNCSPGKINPLQPAELVIDHSVQVDYFGSDESMGLNASVEFQRNHERYQFLKWGQQAFQNFKVVPPDMGIVHQINLESLARVVFKNDENHFDYPLIYPDTVVGTDSHTTMINGLGVLGWGVGGIEAEAALLGQPISMLIPPVVGVELTGELPHGATATDLVLTIVERLRKHGVVGKFVEFYGPGLNSLALADRATIANMAPEYGATCGIFPVDQETLNYLQLTGRDAEQIELIKHYAIAQGIFLDNRNVSSTALYDESLSINLTDVEPCIAGPKRPQDRIPLKDAKTILHEHLEQARQLRHEQQAKQLSNKTDSLKYEYEINNTDNTIRIDRELHLRDGHVVIAAITSCTNTSNPSVLIGAGLLAQKAAQRGLSVKPWVKTSLSPGSKVVTEYLNRSGLLDDLENLGFSVTGYGCMTCIGNSGPLPKPVHDAIRRDDLNVCSVLSGNRNFEGRIHQDVKMNFLASPALVVAYAVAGHMDIDFNKEPLGEDQHSNPVYLRDIWPTADEIKQKMNQVLSPDAFKKTYIHIYSGDDRWQNLEAPDGTQFNWNLHSTYVRKPPYFENIHESLSTINEFANMRVLAYLGDSVTTDHISPAGSIAADSPAGQYLIAQGIEPKDFNSYGSRRGNHEVMMRGTFGNIRLRNKLTPQKEGGYTLWLPNEEELTIYEAASRYRKSETPLMIIAGREYGTGSSRDWAAKGPALLGVKAVLAQSYERIHRSNLIGMGILPLQFTNGENPESLGLTGLEAYRIYGINNGNSKMVTIEAVSEGGETITFNADVRVDTPQEGEYFRHGGILHYVLRQLANT